MIKKLPFLCIACLMYAGVIAQTDYATDQQIANRVKALSNQNPALVSTQSLTKTEGGKDIWAITIGTGDLENKPAMAIFGGIDGRHLLGRELALGFAENLLKSANTDKVKQLLTKHTFYIFPDMSPDASAQYFAKLKYDRQLNARSIDLDRDGKLNEDDFDDLNNDGLITMIRIEDPTGEWRLVEADSRLLVKADLSKGEKGTHRLLSEGIDNDKDGLFNEDGQGGVAFNKNFSFKHPTFTAGAGDYPISEKEIRALLDFMYEKNNIYALFAFGPDDNLFEPFKFNKGGLSQRVITSLYEEDAQMNALISDMYKKQLKVKEGLSSKSAGGDFLNWGYFHFGRYTYSTPGWFVPQVKLAKDTVELKGKDIDHKNPELRYLRWAEKEGLTNAFVDWTTVEHPDFKGMKVEVGGIRPHFLWNPPFSMVDSLVNAHYEFILNIAEMAPIVQLINVQTEAVGKLTRVKVSVYNSGTFATQSELGERVRWLPKIRIDATPAKGQTIISGKKIQLLDRLKADGSHEVEWLIQGKGDFQIKAGNSLNSVHTINVKL